MDPCAHPILEKLDDEQFRMFPSYKLGSRFYRCSNKECGQLMKSAPLSLAPAPAPDPPKE